MSDVNDFLDLLASTARTADALQEFTLHSHKGILLVVDITIVPGVDTVSPRLQVQAGSGGYVTIWTAAAALVASGTTTYLLYPGASGGNFTEVDGIALAERMRLFMDHSAAGSFTYSVRAYRIP